MRRPAAQLACLTAAVALTGCASDAAPEQAGRRTVAIEIRDYRYAPQAVRAKPGRIAFRITNRGRVPHNFNIRGPSRVRLEVSTLLPGETVEAAVKLGRGEFRMYCSIGNHEELGEYGSLEVSR
jgi:plastocyanin